MEIIICSVTPPKLKKVLVFSHSIQDGCAVSIVLSLLRITPQAVVIEAYTLAKVIFVFFELFTTFCHQKVARAHPNYSICYLVAYCSGMVCGCGCCCLCCCNCCRRKPGTWSTALTYYINLVTKINSYFVKLLLGPGTIVTKKSAMYKKDDDVDRYGVSKLYVRNKALSHREISMLAVITFTFGLIVLVIVWNQVLQVTTMSSCAVEDGTSCFPLLSDSSTANISMPTDEPISDCSYWNSEAVSNSVESFRCYRLRFTLIDILSRFGGLLSIMLLALRITFSLALAIIDFLFENFTKSPDEERCWYKTKPSSLVGIVKTGRLLLAYIAYFIEIFSAAAVSRRFFSSPNVEIGFEIVLIVEYSPHAFCYHWKNTA